MNEKHPNIFSMLAGYSTIAVENYLTESFALLLGVLLERAPGYALDFLAKLTNLPKECMFDNPAGILIDTQMQKDSKRPDIEIKQDKSILVYIEIKHDSPLHTGQLEDYHKLLSNSGIPCCRLVLLTRSRPSLTETVLPRQDFHHVCWYEVYEWFAALDTGDAVCQYLIADFRSFLEQKDMNLQKVTWEGWASHTGPTEPFRYAKSCN